jgi:iron(III) transport system ATP-binding protein
MSAVDLRAIHKSYGETPVLADLSLAVPEGSFTAVVGRSGCGKTTLLRMLAGFERADAGEIRLAGQVVDDGRRRIAAERRGVGYVPQEGAVFPHLDVASNILFGLPRAARRVARIDELIELVGLEGLVSRRPHELSGGQQQRVALARALAVGPAIMLLDEPFSALDPELRSVTRGRVKESLAARGTTTILVTHDQDEALSLADRVAILRDGRIVQVGTPKDVYVAPHDADTARFLGDANLLPASLQGAQAHTVLGALELATAHPGPAADALVLIRPETLRLDAVAGAADAGTARVTAVDYHGHDARISLVLETPDAGLELIALTTGPDAPVPGSRVYLSLRDPVHALAVSGS